MFKRNVVIFAFLTLLLLLSNVQAQNLSLQRVSVASDGTQGNGISGSGFNTVDISADGRFTVFVSGADNLVQGDTNNIWDVFVHDRETGITERVSVSSSGQQSALPPGFHDNQSVAISSDGRFVAFSSEASGLLGGSGTPTANLEGIFLRDRLTKQTTFISVNYAIQGSYGNSHKPCFSADTRYIGFDSEATNLVPGDTNGVRDVFIYDRITGQISRVSVNSDGTQGNKRSDYCSLSADGSLVTFHSFATNFGGNVTGTFNQFYVHNRLTGETQLISASSAGEAGNEASGGGVVAANGRYVAFISWASNLIENDTNDHNDVFVHDLITGQKTLVTVSSSGVQTFGGVEWIDISANGRFTTFASSAADLVPNDNNNTYDVFVHDLQTGETRRVSVGPAGEEGNEGSASSAISDDGHWVAFASAADTLLPGHTSLSNWDVFEAEVPFYDVGPAPDTVPDRNYFTSLPITLTWTKLKQAASYEVQVSTSPTFATLEALQSVPANQPRATFDGLANGIYYWRVRAKNSIGVPGAWSAVESFKVNVSP